MSTGERLRRQREYADLTLGQVAKYERVGKSYLSKLEIGTNNPPAWPLLAKLARRYNTSADYLLGLSDDWRPPGSDRPVLTKEEDELITLWRSLTGEQRTFVLETLGKLAQWSQPRIIGSDDDD